MNIGDVRAAMAAALEPIEANINPYAETAPTPPAIQIIPPGVEYDLTFSRGYDEWTWMLQAVVAFNEDVSAQMLLDEMCTPGGPQSVKALLEADPTLGGTIEKLRVQRQSRGQQVQTGAGSPMLLVEFTVQVFAKGA